MNEQTVFQRYEIKYLITAGQRERIRTAMTPHMLPDPHGRSTVCSVYYDTPSHLLIRRSLEGGRYREKLRLRSYGVPEAGDEVFVELKKKFESVVYKRRIAMTEFVAEQYLAGAGEGRDCQIGHEIGYVLTHYAPLQPAVLLSTEREAFFGREDPGFRLTFDENILWRDCDLSLSMGVYGAPLLPAGQVLMELKTGGAIPLWMTELLTQNHIYHTSFSKYGSAYREMLAQKHNERNPPCLNPSFRGCLTAAPPPRFQCKPFCSASERP